MQTTRRGRFAATAISKQGADVAHVENINTEGSSTVKSTTTSKQKEFPCVPEEVADGELPFIAKDLVLERNRQAKSKSTDVEAGKNNEYWIVVDKIVYDCTDFATEHPGGESVFLSFAGEDCSWQFWRLHSKNVMEQYGRALRVGRTEGIKNRFAEPVRYVGLAKLGDDAW